MAFIKTESLFHDTQLTSDISCMNLGEYGRCQTGNYIYQQESASEAEWEDYHGKKKPNIDIGIGNGDLNILRDLVEDWINL